MDPVSNDEWEQYRQLGHQIIDLVIDNMKDIRNTPVWTKMPQEVREHHTLSENHAGEDILNVFEEFKQYILPYGSGNIHPGFFGWVQGGGNIASLIGDILSSSMNMNCGGRDHVGIALEQQVIQWVREWFQFPSESNGVFVTGSSMANFMSVLAAKHRFENANKEQTEAHFVVYTSVAAHRCIQQAVMMCGFPQATVHARTAGLRKIPVYSDYRMNLTILEKEIQADIDAGLIPLMVVATAGSVDVGAIDDLHQISLICQSYNLWMHVDGAYGALGVLSSTVKPLLQGIEMADSIAFDFHKWGQVQYDAGMIIVREGDNLRNTFSSPASYLSRESDGMMGGDYWPCDYGLDLSRGCRAMKTWFTIKTFGIGKMGEVISKSCWLAQELKSIIIEDSSMELLAPVNLNIVCFRFVGGKTLDNATLNRINRFIVLELHASGRVAPSITTINDVIAIRTAIFNHRTTLEDISCLAKLVCEVGRNLIREFE